MTSIIFFFYCQRNTILEKKKTIGTENISKGLRVGNFHEIAIKVELILAALSRSK